MPRHHLFVCVETAARSGRPACGPRGGQAVLARAQQERLAFAGRGLEVTGSQCLGQCFDGPAAVVYPAGCWYGGLTVDDVAPLLASLVDQAPAIAKRLANLPDAEPDDG